MFFSKKDPCDIITYVATAIVVLAFVFFQIQQGQWVGLGAFVVILAILASCCYVGVCPCVKDIRVCMLLAVLAASVVALPQRTVNSSSTETFANPEITESSDVATADVPAVSAQSLKNVPDQLKKLAKEAGIVNNDEVTSNDKNDKGGDDDDDDEKEPNYVDTFSTFMETYKSLSPGQIETMTTDTKDLIATQKSLMDTVKSLAPVITQGKEMMDTFKDYFGPNSHQDLMKAFKGTSK